MKYIKKHLSFQAATIVWTFTCAKNMTDHKGRNDRPAFINDSTDKLCSVLTYWDEYGILSYVFWPYFCRVILLLCKSGLRQNSECWLIYIYTHNNVWSLSYEQVSKNLGIVNDIVSPTSTYTHTQSLNRLSGSFEHFVPTRHTFSDNSAFKAALQLALLHSCTMAL